MYKIYCKVYCTRATENVLESRIQEKTGNADKTQFEATFHHTKFSLVLAEHHNRGSHVFVQKCKLH